MIYVDGTSTISADGLPGGPAAATDCAPSGTETPDAAAGRFLTFWKQHQGNTLFGPPISEPLMEVQEGTNKTYLVQYFANARLEYHPEVTNPSFQVQLGRLGYEYLHTRGML